MSKCTHGYRGDCCCNCAHQVQIMKHPWNKGNAKGSISSRMGWGCACQLEDNSMKGKVVYSDSKHGMCELHKEETE